MNNNKIRQLRIEAGVSISEALNNLNISYSMLSKIERYERAPDTSLILKMSKLYNCPIDKIFKVMEKNN